MDNGIAEPNDNIMKSPFFIEHASFSKRNIPKVCRIKKLIQLITLLKS
jgi:hypothetical protein